MQFLRLSDIILQQIGVPFSVQCSLISEKQVEIFLFYYNILIVGHKDSTGMLSAYFENFKVETIYDDYLKLASPNCGYKKYVLEK